MRNFTRTLLLAATMVAVGMAAGGARAQASRTWVSGVGDDANPCSRTAPCKTFPGAISKTAAGGEIDALDPGGFGGVTITKAITLDGGGGQVASILVTGTPGITVAAGASDVVTIRNLRINGIVNGANGGTNGIRFVSGAALHVENCFIFGFTQAGIDIETGATSSTFVSDTILSNNATGVKIAVAAGTARSWMDRVQANGNSGTGFAVSNTAPGVATMLLKSSASILNGTGVSGDGANAFVLLDQNDIAGNVTGVSATNGAHLLSYKNNGINGNTTDGTPLTALGLN